MSRKPRILVTIAIALVSILTCLLVEVRKNTFSLPSGMEVTYQGIFSGEEFAICSGGALEQLIYSYLGERRMRKLGWKFQNDKIRRFRLSDSPKTRFVAFAHFYSTRTNNAQEVWANVVLKAHDENENELGSAYPVISTSANPITVWSVNFKTNPPSSYRIKVFQQVGTNLHQLTSISVKDPPVTMPRTPARSPRTTI